MHLAEGLRQSKLITCITGKIRDVLVDLRPDSLSFGRAEIVDISGESPATVFCPPGVAHGFIALDPGSIVTLAVDVPFSEVTEQAIDAFDPDLGIDWLMPKEDCVRSERDQSAPQLRSLRLN
ncbi:dTDP-4-keto-6-deoxy-D-glucose epimerase [Dietzia sp. DQ11-71]|nr:dTDP-4-keto-6-deoxy-D-glucose epimerase [Dietzia sp. DQ11-71]